MGTRLAVAALAAVGAPAVAVLCIPEDAEILRAPVSWLLVGGPLVGFGLARVALGVIARGGADAAPFSRRLARAVMLVAVPVSLAALAASWRASVRPPTHIDHADAVVAAARKLTDDHRARIRQEAELDQRRRLDEVGRVSDLEAECLASGHRTSSGGAPGLDPALRALDVSQLMVACDHVDLVYFSHPDGRLGLRVYRAGISCGRDQPLAGAPEVCRFVWDKDEGEFPTRR